MKPLAALIAVLALAAGAAPAAAEQRLATESAPFTADAFGDVIAWSSYDAASRRTRCACCAASTPVDTAAVAPSAAPFDLDVGPGPSGAPLVVYSRRGDLFQFDPATGAEQPLAEVNTKGTELHPSIRRERARVRAHAARPQGAADALPAPGREHAQAAAPAVQGDAGDRGRRAQRPRPVRRLPHRHRADVLHARRALQGRGQEAAAPLLRRQRRRELRPARDAERGRPQRLLRAHQRGLGPGEQPVPLRPRARASCSPRAGRAGRSRSPGAATAS